MTEYPDEAEIKIEYHESFEVDPLSDKLEKTQTTRTFENLSDIPGFAQDLQDKETWYKEIDNLGRYVCKFCELTYSTVQTLRYHVKLKHSDKASDLKNKVIKNKRNMKIKCHVCKMRFKILSNLKNHLNQQHTVQNVEASCFNCDATFENNDFLVDHLYLKHNIRKQKIFTCNICGYRTLKSSHFNQHKNTHFKSKDIECKFCDYRTNYLPNMKIHERVHSDEKPYDCNYQNCEYRSFSKAALRSHLLKHNREENLLYCEKCGYKTVYHQSLKKHIESHIRNGIKTVL